MAAKVRKAPYKDFLQPSLQRRFLSTALVLLVVAYLEALLLASWKSSLLWSWLPIGSAGVRTIGIFSCGLALLILRVANYHVGVRTSGPGWQVVRSHLSQLQTYETAFWYGVSSLVFCPIFLFSMDKDANLRFITYYSGDRARLNERPVFLACYLSCCALVQIIYHYRNDVDRLPLKLPNVPTVDQKEQAAAAVDENPFNTIVQGLPTLLFGSLNQAVRALPVAIVLYFSGLRSFAWSWTLMVTRPFYNLPKSGLLPNSWPLDLPLLARCLFAGFLLSFIWDAGNAAFSIFMAQPPMKNGKPLTFESKDPNGSLLNGLKSQKPSIKTFAMWELAQIAETSAVRRTAVFQDIDRKDGPMWSQVYAICMDAIKTMESRVDNYGKTVALAPVAAPVDEPRRRSTAPLRDEPIFNKRGNSDKFQQELGTTFNHVACSPGSSPMGKISPMVKKKWNEATDRLLAGENPSQRLQSEVNSRALPFMDNDLVGAMFRQDFADEFAAAVLGAPYAETTLYVHAVLALTWLATNSLTEDEYGNVHRDVPIIIRTLTALIKKTEGLKERFPIHWTDTKGIRKCPQVDVVLDAARVGLERVVAKFEPYSTDLRLSLTDLRLAKEATIKPAEPTPPAPKQATVEDAPQPAARKIENGSTRAPVERRPQRSSRTAARQERNPEMEQVR